MTLRQRIFYLIGIYVFCGYLRIFVKETAKVTLRKIEEAKAKQEVGKSAATRRASEAANRHDAARFV